MKTEQIGMGSFRILAETGGATDYVIQRHNGLYHLFAVNLDRQVAYYLRERRGDYKTWTSLDRAAAFLDSIGVKEFRVRA